MLEAARDADGVVEGDRERGWRLAAPIEWLDEGLIRARCAGVDLSLSVVDETDSTQAEVERRRIRAEVRRFQQSGAAVKVIIGAGATRYSGWIATDLPAFDILKGGHWARLFPRRSIDRMLAEHVFEHLTAEQFAAFLGRARAYLKPSGRIRIAVPDGNHPDADYIARVRPGGSGPGAAEHKLLYTCAQMGALLRQSGYQYTLLEYFDAAGLFQRRPWEAQDGFIRRSAAHDRRNAAGELRYTSLIVDCWL